MVETVERLPFVSTHSRPKAAGYADSDLSKTTNVSTHSRPKAAGSALFTFLKFLFRFNTQPPEGGWAVCLLKLTVQLLFQHTAARRRLEQTAVRTVEFVKVSTHSRPKAAGL